ncbi:MAG: flagellar basal body P-ring protein FlgI [Candidatus Kapaibacterium sp.]|jgi:flagellar P-ring protein precursor FlgI
MKRSCLIIIALLWLISYAAEATRIKDIATIEGVAGTQVVGYGLVTGLSNNGDTQQSRFTIQTITNMLKRFGVTVPAINTRTRNVAAVMVTATIPPFLRKGSRIDVQVSSLGDARSLQGGVLIMTPLSAADGTLLATAQGGLSVGGYDFQQDGSRVGRNFVASGRVPNGGIIEQEVRGEFVQNQLVRIVLREPDFTTATRVATAINGSAGLANTASAIDAATVEVKIPTGQTQAQIVQTIAQIEALQVTSDPYARVVVNERTGTIVVGGAVQLLPAVVAHGSLEIQIQRTTTQPQQAPFTTQQPRQTQNSALSAQEEEYPPVVLPATTTVQDMANALNLLKVKPRDLIAIMQALKEAGSLQGELIIQ